MRDPVTGKEVPVVGQAGALPPASAPPSPGGNANVAGAPLPQNGANGPQGGGAVLTQQQGGQGGQAGQGQGGGQQQPGFDAMKERGPSGDIIPNAMRNDAAALLVTGEESAGSLETTRANSNGQSNSQAIALAENLEANGVPIKKSFDEMKEEVEKGLRRGVEDKKITAKEAAKQRKGWRKVFNTVHEDEMGLFLIDFGLRAMMAGESMGSAGAIGAAGSGAMGALQGRRQTEIDQETALTGEAHKRALAQFGAESDRISADASTSRAEAANKRADNAIAGYQGKDAWLARRYASSGWSTEDINTAISGGDSPEQRSQLWAKRFEEMKVDPKLSYTKRTELAGWSSEKIQKWIAKKMQETDAAADAYRKAKKSGALDQNVDDKYGD